MATATDHTLVMSTANTGRQVKPLETSMIPLQIANSCLVNGLAPASRIVSVDGTSREPRL